MEIKFFKFKKSFKKGGFHSSPDVFWQFYLLLGLVVVIAAAIFGLMLFMEVNTEPVLDSDVANGKSQAVNEQKINSALEYFRAREQASNEIRNNPSAAIDPSL
jgi:hypothetical protein